MKKLIFIATALIICQTTFGQWNRANGIGDRFIYAIRQIDNYVFTATDSGVYRSSDGINWQMKINGMDSTSLNTREFYKNGINLYAASMAGLYVSTDYGDHWQITSYPHPGNPAISVFAINNIVLASTTGGGLYRSKDYGITWQTGSGDNFWKYAMINGKLFASTFQDVSVSLDTGITWQSTNFNDWAFDLLNVNDTLLATTFSNSIAQTPSGTINWNYLNALQIDSAVGFAVKSDTIFTCSYDSVYFFKKRNIPANKINRNGLNIFPANKLSAIEIFNDLILVGTQNSSAISGKGVWYYSLNLSSGITEVDNENNIEIYPNPANTFINLKINNNTISQIEISNALGEIIYSTKNIHDAISIDISSFAKGVYFIRTTSINQNTYRVKKIVKN